MATLWSVLTVLTLIAAAVSFTLVVYPIRLLGSDARKGAGIVLVASTFLLIFALRAALGIP